MNEANRRRLSEAEYVNVGGSPNNSRVTLGIYAADLEPDFVSRLVGCAPTGARRLGERDPARPRSAPAFIGNWLLAAPRELPFRDQIQFLLDATTAEEASWLQLASSHQLQLRAAIFLQSWTEGFELPAEMVMNLAKRRWMFSLAMYSADGDEIVDAFLRREGEDDERTAQ